MKRSRIIIALLVVAALAAGAIGWATAASGDSASDMRAASSSMASQAMEEKNIVETALTDGRFTTLAMLLDRAGLVSTLEQPGPYTVFAPTDAAFKKVPKKTLNALLADKAKLKAVLLYHVVSGKVTAADVVKLMSATTVNGKDVRIRVSGPNVFVNKAKVTKPDVMASNGVIHVINRVLIPPTR
jgi:uncharacterized surface protein with fasciclin (FAS1) repeats